MTCIPTVYYDVTYVYDDVTYVYDDVTYASRYLRCMFMCDVHPTSSDILCHMSHHLMSYVTSSYVIRHIILCHMSHHLMCDVHSYFFRQIRIVFVHARKHTTHTQTHTCTQARTRTHRHIHASTHTHAHTSTYIPPMRWREF